MASIYSLRALVAASDPRTASRNAQAVSRGAWIAITVQVIASIAYAGQFPWSKAWTILGGALIIAAAAYVVGVLLGFLFGLPRTLDDSREPAEAPATTEQSDSHPPLPTYRTNTNLEQISDWLTKILVGVGLVELAKLPSVLHSLGLWVKPALGNSANSEAFGVGLFIYDAVTGFLAGYLLTRLHLASALSWADRVVWSRTVLQRVLRRRERDPDPGPEGAGSEGVSSGAIPDEQTASDLDVLAKKLEEVGLQLDVDSYMRLALQLKRAKKYEDAEQAYLKASSIDPNNPAPLNWAGVLRGKYLGQHDKADEYYRRAISLDPSYMSATYNRACNEMRRGNKEEALKLLAIAIAADEKYRKLARRDAKPQGPFEALQKDASFQSLIGIEQQGESDE
ncbi:MULTISPECIES: tetratricopeptide repeat protein [Streptomyces]|uniref:Tetratricopeptide repeat protein n=1 Tax=Streptomyces griseocarneus TaxID=51201 RepID=A0ABX7RLB4_9ACTN|nr:MULTISPECIES: tetratricopeptide repeat protein [Streptomyces]QSY48115.1 tetratricopeptide repeat protein [Streptomyces griseocarneus]